MSSLASIIRSGLIWRALPPQNHLSQKPLAKTLATADAGISTPDPSVFTPCTSSESKELYELCCEQVNGATLDTASPKNTSLRGVVPFGIPAIDADLATAGLPYGTLHEWYVDSDLPIQHRHPYTMFSWLAVQTWREVLQSPAQKRRFIFWIGKETWPSPHLLAELSRGIISGSGDNKANDFFNSNFFLDVSGEKEQLWSIETALRSSATALVIGKLKTTSLAITRRLHLAAQRGNALGLFSISDKMKMTATSAHSRWRLEAIKNEDTRRQSTKEAHPTWDLTLEKWKGAQPQNNHWCIGLSAPSIKDLYFNSQIEASLKASHQGTSSAYGTAHTETTISLHISPQLVDRSGDTETARSERIAS